MQNELWLRLLALARQENGITLASPRQEVELKDAR